MKKVLKIIGIIVGAIVAAALIYVAYVFISFHRIEDNQQLEIMTAAGASGSEELSAAVKTGEEITAVSYNIGFGAYSDDYTFFMDGGKESRARSEEAVYTNIQGAMAAVEPYDADIVFIQEVDIDGTRSYHIDERDIVIPGIIKNGAYSYVFAQNYDSPYLLYPFTQPHGANKAGIMTFSDTQITSAVRRSLPIEEGLSKVLDLDRCYSVSRVPADNGKELVIYNLHLSAYTSSSETAETQLSLLVQDMQKEYDAGNYCIAGGDFNRDLLGNSPEIFHTATLDDNWAKPVNMELFTDDITLVVPFDENDPKASCRNPDKPYEEGDFVVTVDGFIKSANIDIVKADVIQTGYRYSDHNPVYVKFILN